MSNHLAVAATTRTLAHLLDAELTQDFPAAHAVPGRPDANAANADPQARIFLYRVEPNAAWRTTALPSRSPTGQLYERPQIGLTLQYLVTFVGNETLQEPQRILGSVMRTLNARPVLTRDEIDAMVTAAVAEDAASPMALTDLAEQPEIIRVTPLLLTLDELSSLWSSFFQTPYQLSVAYEACVVVLTADDLPTRSLPVRERRIFTTTMLRPTISAATAADGPFHPVQVGTTLVISGNQLRGDDVTVVAFGGVEVAPDPAGVTGARIEVPVPADARAGAVGLRVIHRRPMGDPPEPRLAGQSAAFPVVVQPRITTDAEVHDVEIDAETTLRSGGITVSVEPLVGSRQMVTLVLNAVPGGTGQSFVFEDERRDDPGDTDETADLDIAFVGVPAGDYLYRVTVDGAESPLEIDATPGATEGQYAGPVVTVP